MLSNSIYKLLNNDKNGELERCWLAATNKRGFEKLKAENIEDIAIPNLCTTIWKNVKDMNSKLSLSFSSAAKLMFGAVLIYKSQVDSLFEQTLKLNHHKQFLFFGALGRNDGLKVESIKRKKTNKLDSNAVSWTSTDLLNEVEEIENLGGNQLLTFDDNFQCTRNEDISLKETSNAERWEKNIDDSEEDFLGQITDVEISFLAEVIAKRQNLFNSSNGSNTFFDLMRSTQNTNDNMEVDVLNVGIDDLNKTPNSPIYRSINSPANSIPIADQMILPSALNSSTNMINVNIDAEIIPNPNQGRKKRKLIIDKQIELTADYVKKRLTEIDTLRCTNPREDIVPINNICIPAEKLLSNVCSRKNNLVFNFHKKLKRKKESTDVNQILSEILGINISETSENECLNFSKDSKKRKRDPKKTNNISEENNIDNLNDTAIPRTNENNLPINLDPQVQNVLKQIIEEFPTEISKEHSNEIENHRALAKKRRIISDFNVLAIIGRLLKLWHQKVYPINTSILFDPYLACKLGAAKGFSSILELNGKRYIKIIKDNTTHNIIHIEPGEKIHCKFNLI